MQLSTTSFVVCLLLHWAQKGVDTAFWSCSKKYISFESFFRKFCWCSFAHSNIFLQKYSIPQHLCKLFSILIAFFRWRKCSTFSFGHIFTSHEFRTELPIDFYRNFFFRSISVCFSLLINCHQYHSSFSAWPLVRVECPIWRNFKPKYHQYNNRQ